MKKEEMIPGRRALLRIAACLGAVVTTRVMFPGETRAPGAAAAPAPAAGPPAARPPAGAARNPAAYRLLPMTGDAPSGRLTPAPPVRRKPFLELPQVGHTMVLTFDDGPDPRYTPDILRTLRAHDVRAMFFVCGEMASYNRDLVRQMAADGHIVGNHTWSHPQMVKLAPSAIRKEMERTSEVIEDTTGTPPVWYRAPYGAWNRHSFEIGAELGMEPLAWTVDTLDWTTPGTDRIVKAVRDGAGPGVVVLSHDAGGNREQSVAALRRYLPELIAEGYGIGVPHP
ncbi:polysaccharide deacetylase family protein [Streptomyces liangshanensis]|uniref:Polysaccharide deacetylase family protein n=1 Tax=Streptomyces liangshanensis TaxID=2717324 RepID=A0A6G9GT76_9ACTN|nr:polysaccharide deacetylase family protein [Streptomyces liangshanensis]QIQ01400.1 polysaccharide deacetylase family protein [Streptomyces liangshanensis]